MRGTRAAARIAGATLLIGTFAVWVVVGTPGLGASEFGTAPVAPAPVPAITTPEPVPVPVPAGEGEGEAEVETATEVERVTEPPLFTTTTPRGAIDQGAWPTSVSIPRLRVDAPVQAVGVGSEGALIVPHSPMDVGWYQGGSVPGEPGVALLTSHVDTREAGRGVFAGLVDLQAGDTVTTTAADGSTQRWTVTARTQHHKSELPTELFARAGAPVLALVTCGGPFDREARSYRDNVVVWADPLTAPSG
jgi:sortase (surface protein transpeptidase)